MSERFRDAVVLHPINFEPDARVRELVGKIVAKVFSDMEMQSTRAAATPPGYVGARLTGPAEPHVPEE